MPEKVTPLEIEKRDLIQEIDRLNGELAASKSREKNLQSLVEKLEGKVNPTLTLHYEGVILRQRMTLNNYTEVLWKRKQTIKMLRERLLKAEKRNRKNGAVVIPLDDEEVRAAKTA